MTLALVVLIVFLVVWFFDSAKKKDNKLKQRQKTITNVKSQDELWCKNFKEVMAVLDELDKTKPLETVEVMPAIEALFDKYNVPDTRTQQEKQNATALYIKAIRSRQDPLTPDELRYPNDASVVPFCFKIFYASYPRENTPPPFLENPELLFGEPDSTKKLDGIEIKYDYTGRAKILSEPYSLICRICNLMTIRDLRQSNFNFSWDRKGSEWQQSAARAAQLEQDKKNYPWLYQ